jgi:hypothetical protein
LCETHLFVDLNEDLTPRSHHTRARARPTSATAEEARVPVYDQSASLDQLNNPLPIHTLQKDMSAPLRSEFNARLTQTE